MTLGVNRGKKFSVALLLIVITILACNSKKMPKTINFSSTKAGTIINMGDSIELRLDIPEDNTIDSIVYLVDGNIIGKKLDNTTFYFDTNGQTFGSKLIVARHYQDGKESQSTSNVVIVPSSAPAQYAFSVVNTFPYDTKAYTQ